MSHTDGCAARVGGRCYCGRPATPPPGEAGWERRLEDLARAQEWAVGRCGAESPNFGFLPNSICALPAGHAGWHREGQTEWGPRYGSTPLAAQDGSGRAEMGGRDTETGAGHREAYSGADGVTEADRQRARELRRATGQVAGWPVREAMIARALAEERVKARMSFLALAQELATVATDHHATVAGDAYADAVDRIIAVLDGTYL